LGSSSAIAEYQWSARPPPDPDSLLDELQDAIDRGIMAKAAQWQIETWSHEAPPLPIGKHLLRGCP